MNQENNNEANQQTAPQEPGQASMPDQVNNLPQAQDPTPAPEAISEQNNNQGQNSSPSKKLIILSLVLHYGPSLLFATILAIGAKLSGFLSSVSSSLAVSAFGIVGPGWFASWIIAIVAAVKHKSTGSKILIGIYSLEFIGIIILAVGIIKGIVDLLESCSELGFLM